MTDEDEGTLSMLRLGDSFLPVGSNSLSYGLEGFVADGRVESAADLGEFLRTYLERLLGPADLVALRAAHAAGSEADLDGVLRADRRLHAVTLAAELRESATRAGERLLDVQRDVHEDGFVERYADAERAPHAHPVALGVVAARTGVPVREACLTCCHAFVSGLLGAAQRLFALGATAAQRLLVDLRPAMTAAVEDSADRSLDEMTPFAPLVDLLSAEHERADRRLFLS